MHISNDIKTLFSSDLPVVALNLMGISLLAKGIIESQKCIFWIDGIAGVWVSKVFGGKQVKMRGEQLLENLFIFFEKNDLRSMIVLGDAQSYPRLQQRFGTKVSVQKLAFFKDLEEIKRATFLQMAKRQLVLIAIASPKQEAIATKLFECSGAKVFCIGGALNMFEGKEKAAPKIIVRLCLEWVFRLQNQPIKRIDRLLRSLPSAFLFLAKLYFFKKR